MFDPVTARLLQEAPSLPGLDRTALPAALTDAYTRLVVERLRQARGEREPDRYSPEWKLSRLADTYEVLASVLDHPEERSASAFVAGTAQQILAREVEQGSELILSRDIVDPRISAPLLFLAARQYADAAEAARAINATVRPDSVEGGLVHAIRNLALGRLAAVATAPQSTASGGFDAHEDAATSVLYLRLLEGLRRFAEAALSADLTQAGRDNSTSRALFAEVAELSTRVHPYDERLPRPLTTYYPGPHHLARLLLIVEDVVGPAATTGVPAPPGSDPGFWRRWLEHRARTIPFLWPNHQAAVELGFQEPGTSAVLVLPTGAGKTTVSCIKIAAALARGGSVVFVVPTNALADQLAADLAEVFPEELLGFEVSAEYDALFTGAAVRRVEVMTPERCLAVLSYAPEAFDNADLMVFDECHMIDPNAGFRRSLDAMFCVLAFNGVRPEADFLFLSAMLQNSAEFAAWVEELTGRPCQGIDLLWKPSRQARGVVVYHGDELAQAERAAIQMQAEVDSDEGRRAANLRLAARRLLTVTPYAVFGLQNNWRRDALLRQVTSVRQLRDGTVPLNGSLRGRAGLAITSNSNSVAAEIARDCADAGLKTIVFANQRKHAESIARTINGYLTEAPSATKEEEARWSALEAELGGISHAVLSAPAMAVVHHSQMLRLERDLSERMFRRRDGAAVIVATPTLAQGLNLPAEVAVLAGDTRYDSEDNARESMEPHEVLNAAARAGRAGHLANGLVLLVPDVVLQFRDADRPGGRILAKLDTILPDDDRCVVLSDPLEYVLDQIASGEPVTADLEYAINRLATTVAPAEVEPDSGGARVELKRSFGAFLSRRRGEAAAFEQRLADFSEAVQRLGPPSSRLESQQLAARSGLSPAVIDGLRSRLLESGALPVTVAGWVSWTLAWLAEDETARDALLNSSWNGVCRALGVSDADRGAVNLTDLDPGVQAWIAGRSLYEIDVVLGGPETPTSRCDRARHLCLSVIPLGLTNALALVSQTTTACEEELSATLAPRSVVEVMSRAVRLGLDSPQKVAFHEVERGLLTRVQYHVAYPARLDVECSVRPDEGQAEVIELVRLAVEPTQG